MVLTDRRPTDDYDGRAGKGGMGLASHGGPWGTPVALVPGLPACSGRRRCCMYRYVGTLAAEYLVTPLRSSSPSHMAVAANDEQGISIPQVVGL